MSIDGSICIVKDIVEMILITFPVIMPFGNPSHSEMNVVWVQNLL